MRLKILTLLLFLTFISGCASQRFEGLEPIYPKLIRRRFLSQFPGCDVPRVDSLSPTFSWKGLGEGETYDFAIWDAIKSRRNLSAETNRLNYTPGIQIYYREDLKETSHKPDIELLPLKQYYWSVKVSGSDQWTKFNWKGGSATLKNSLFFFETPFGDDE